MSPAPTKYTMMHSVRNSVARRVGVSQPLRFFSGIREGDHVEVSGRLVSATQEPTTKVFHENVKLQFSAGDSRYNFAGVDGMSVGELKRVPVTAEMFFGPQSQVEPKDCP